MLKTDLRSTVSIPKCFGFQEWETRRVVYDEDGSQVVVTETKSLKGPDMPGPNQKKMKPKKKGKGG